MKSSRNTARQLFGLTLTLVGLLSWNTLPIHASRQAVQAATRASVTEPTGQAVSRAVANGRVAFVSSEGGARSDIYTMNPDGSNVQRLTNNPAEDLSPKWSPDGTRIAFASSRDDTSVGCTSGSDCKHEIYVMNADGTDQTRTNNTGFLPLEWFSSIDDSFDWSPDGTRIVFESGHDLGSDSFILSISVMNADGSNVRRLTNNPGFDYSPKWSPDGKKIAFGRADDFIDQDLSISVMNADGTNQTRLVSPAWDPRWSPDGTKIVFVSADIFDARSLEIYVMNTDGSNVQRLTNNSTWDADPRWSPDGTKIAFVRRRVGTPQCPSGAFCSYEIYVMNANGTNQTRLTDSPAGDYSPIFSPDSTKIAFISRRDGNSDIYGMNADGSSQMRLTNTAAGAYEAELDWQALPQAAANPIDTVDFFVRQHYRDFLNRQADDLGLAFWTNEITSCGADPQCIEAKRINVSAAFFLSIEFQQTGYLVYRFYKGAYGNLPGAPVPLRFSEFLPDTQKIGQGVIVNQAGWETVLENNKQAFAAEFVQRSRFTSAYPTSLTPEQFVDQLFMNAGVTPSATDRAAAINEFGSAANTADIAARARTLRRVAEDSTLAQQEFNRAFVLMQYFGYLRRNPNDAPDNNFDGYNFWLAKLDQFNGNFIDAEMVKAFITSIEYRQRFGP